MLANTQTQLYVKHLALAEQLVSYYGAHANDQPCKIDESLIFDVHWILGYEMWFKSKFVEKDDEMTPEFCSCQKGKKKKGY